MRGLSSPSSMSQVRRVRLSAFPFYLLGRQMTLKLNSDKNSDHLACLAFSCFEVIKYSKALQSKYTLISLSTLSYPAHSSSSGLNSLKDRTIASNSLSYIRQLHSVGDIFLKKYTTSFQTILPYTSYCYKATQATTLSKASYLIIVSLPSSKYASIGSLVNISLSFLNARQQTGIHSNTRFPSPSHFFVKSVIGAAYREKLKINCLQKFTKPRKARTSFTVRGTSYSQIAFTFSGSILIPLVIIISPRYLVSQTQKSHLSISIGSPAACSRSMTLFTYSTYSSFKLLNIKTSSRQVEQKSSRYSLKLLLIYN